MSTTTKRMSSSKHNRAQNKRSPIAMAEVLNNRQLLAQILSNLWSVPALARGRLVCHRWLEVIERTVLPRHRHLYITFNEAPCVVNESPKSLKDLDQPDRFDPDNDEHFYRELKNRFNGNLFGYQEQRQLPFLKVVYDRRAEKSKKDGPFGVDCAEFSKAQAALLARWFPRVEWVCLNLGFNSEHARAVDRRTETAANFATLLASAWPRLHTLSVWPASSAGPLFRGENGRALTRKLRRLDFDHGRMDHTLGESKEHPQEEAHFLTLWSEQLEHFSIQGFRDDELFVKRVEDENEEDEEEEDTDDESESETFIPLLPPLGQRCVSLSLQCSEGMHASRLANWVDSSNDPRLARVLALSLGRIENRELEEEDTDDYDDFLFAGPKRRFSRHHANVGVQVFQVLGDHFTGLIYLSLEFKQDLSYAKLSPAHFSSLSSLKLLQWLKLKRINLDLAEFEGEEAKTVSPFALPSVTWLFLNEFSLTGVMLDPDDDSDENSSSSSSEESESESSDESSDGCSDHDHKDDVDEEENKLVGLPYQPGEEGYEIIPTDFLFPDGYDVADEFYSDTKKGKGAHEQGDDEVYDPEASFASTSDDSDGDSDENDNKNKRKKLKLKKTHFDADHFCRVLSKVVPNLVVLGVWWMQHGGEHIVPLIRIKARRYFPRRNNRNKAAFEVVLVE